MISMQAKNSENEAIAQTSDHLIAFYRGILNRGQVETTIREEIEMLLVYIQITKAVYGLDIETVMEVEEEMMDCRAIKLFLQPIVENAVVHGIRPVQSGVIVITGRKKTDRLEFMVSDNGVGMKPEVMEKLNRLSAGDSPAQFYGISNVVRRIKLFYGEEYGVRFSALAEGGTVASVAIPVLDGEQMRHLLTMPYMVEKGDERMSESSK
jgi:two-component system sensor histidine kinase YesM